ncbi:MAG TPA: hypothetical protein VGH55_02840, partial [Chthoniobacterales bacterium]
MGTVQDQPLCSRFFNSYLRANVDRRNRVGTKRKPAEARSQGFDGISHLVPGDLDAIWMDIP